MSNALAVLGGGPPAIAQARQSSLNAAAQANVVSSFATVSYKGKVWKIKYRGEETVLKNDEGLPLQALDVVVVGVASGISKQFYAKGFAEGDAAAPDCFSVNGVTPDASAPKKQCATCAVCPMNQWGSKVTEQGTKAKACQDSRRVAIVPETDLQNEGLGGPVMMRMPPTTLANFASYGGMLSKRGAGMEYVVTRMTFDPEVAYPKITFQPKRWLTQEEAIEVVGDDGGVMSHPSIERMLNEAVDEVAHSSGTPAVDESVVDPLAVGGPAPVFAQPAPVAAPAQTPTPTPAPVPQPAPPVEHAPAPVAKKGGFGGAPAAQPAPPVASKKGFGVTTVAAAPAATVTQAAPVDPSVLQAAPVQVIQQAPPDLENAIDGLLGD